VVGRRAQGSAQRRQRLVAVEEVVLVEGAPDVGVAGAVGGRPVLAEPEGDAGGDDGDADQDGGVRPAPGREQLLARGGQGVAQLAHAGEAGGGVLGQRASDDGGHRLGHGERRRRLVADLREELVDDPRPVGRLAGQDLVGDDAEREDLAALVGRAAGDLLGRHVHRGAQQRAGVGLEGGAGHRAGVHGRIEGRDRIVAVGDGVEGVLHRAAGERSLRGGPARDGGAGQRAGGRRWRHRRGGSDGAAVAQLGQAEVEHLHAARLGDHHVRRLDVAVQDALVVGGGQRVGDGDQPVEGLAQRRCAAALQQVGQGLAVDQLHDQDVVALVGDDVEQRHHAGVRHRRRRPRLAQHAGPPLGIAGRARRQDLQRDVAVEPLVARPPDLAHRAAAEPRQQAVRSDADAGLGHGVDSNRPGVNASAGGCGSSPAAGGAVSATGSGAARREHSRPCCG
jgi:hypothetical protein